MIRIPRINLFLVDINNANSDLKVVKRRKRGKRRVSLVVKKVVLDC